jgi:hypothetical protein
MVAILAQNIILARTIPGLAFSKKAASIKIMRRPHYRVTFAQSNIEGKFQAFMNEISVEPDKFSSTIEDFESTFLKKHRRIERSDIGTPDNECERHIYVGNRSQIYLYIYPPR